jgi:hypothetical protein
VGRSAGKASGSGKGLAASCCEHGNEPSGSTRGGEFHDYLNDLASQEELCSMELVGRSVGQSVSLKPLNAITDRVTAS